MSFLEMVFIEFNSVNHDKAVQWSSYQRLYPSGNKYKTNGSNGKDISIMTFGLMSIATHHIEKIPNQR